MFCFKCGEAIPDGSSACPKCGIDLTNKSEEQVVVYASQKKADMPTRDKSIKRIPMVICIGIVVAICITAIIFIAIGISKENLKRDLVKKWYNVDGSILMVLDIDEHELEYRLETGYSWIDSTLISTEWEPVNGHTIKIKRYGKYKIYTVELNDDKDVLKISPAITSDDLSETWYYID